MHLDHFIRIKERVRLQVLAQGHEIVVLDIWLYVVHQVHTLAVGENRPTGKQIGHKDARVGEFS